MSKQISIVLYRRNFVGNWRYLVDPQSISDLADELNAEMASAGVSVRYSGEEEGHVDVKGYGDILNAIRLRSSEPGTGNPCLGHIIGSSPDRDLLADIRRGVSRLAFAPEMIMPDAEHRKTCHNCGCGC